MQSLQTLINSEFQWHLMLVQGNNPHGLPLYAMVAVQEKNLSAFTAAQSQPNFQPESYGTVIGRGFGKEPPSLYKLEMIKKFEMGEWH